MKFATTLLVVVIASIALLLSLISCAGNAGQESANSSLSALDSALGDKNYTFVFHATRDDPNRYGFYMCHDRSKRKPLRVHNSLTDKDIFSSGLSCVNIYRDPLGEDITFSLEAFEKEQKRALEAWNLAAKKYQEQKVALIETEQKRSALHENHKKIHGRKRILGSTATTLSLASYYIAFMAIKKTPLLEVLETLSSVAVVLTAKWTLENQTRFKEAAQNVAYHRHLKKKIQECNTLPDPLENSECQFISDKIITIPKESTASDYLALLDTENTYGASSYAYMVELARQIHNMIDANGFGGEYMNIYYRCLPSIKSTAPKNTAWCVP